MMLFTQCSSHAPSDPLGLGPLLGLGYLGLGLRHLLYLISIITSVLLPVSRVPWRMSLRRYYTILV